MSSDPNSRTPFDLCGGHAALDFVNSLDRRFGGEPLELLGDYGDLLRFAEQSQVLDASRIRALARSVTPGAAARALRAARELREAMASVLYSHVDGHAPSADAVRVLERRLHDADLHRELRWERGVARQNRPPALQWRWGRFERDAELPVWILAQSASKLMLSKSMEHVRACGAPTCRWLFLDTSKNHTRRWCNMKICGNRMKARRFQARRAQ
jgi:predicted RNA-binding Zn ribbon-like protein